MSKISRQDYQKRLDRLTEIFSDIVSHADKQAETRCPYRDRQDRCTAAFKCRNQTPIEGEAEAWICGHDGAFDYRDAWETDPKAYDRAKKRLDEVQRSAAAKRRGDDVAAGKATISHDGETRPLAIGKTVFDYADELAVEVPTSCHRNGRCHECVVDVGQGGDALSARTDAESFLRGSYRLACQAMIERDDLDVVFAPLRRRPRILTLGESSAPASLDPLADPARR